MIYKFCSGKNTTGDDSVVSDMNIGEKLSGNIFMHIFICGPLRSCCITETLYSNLKTVYKGYNDRIKKCVRAFVYKIPPIKGSYTVKCV